MKELESSKFFFIRHADKYLIMNYMELYDFLWFSIEGPKEEFESRRAFSGTNYSRFFSSFTLNGFQ